mgnify:CR=1 FL=1
MKWTKISLIHNIDGCHTMTSLKCYMNCDPFTALSILMSDYYIQSYCGEELYHMAYVGYKYALQIDEIAGEDDMILYRFYEMNDDMFENYIPIDSKFGERAPLRLARAGKDPRWDDDYSTRLSVLLNNNEVISKAAEVNSIIHKCDDIGFDIMDLGEPEKFTKLIETYRNLLYPTQLSGDIINEIFKYVLFINKARE